MARTLYTPEEAAQRFEALPDEVKNLLYSPEMVLIIRQIAQKHQLHIDQTGILEDETSSVMLGFTQAAEYPALLAEVLHVDPQKAAAIAQDVESLLFGKIREQMKKTYEAAKSGPRVISAPTPAPSAPAAPTTPSPVEEIPPPPKGALGSTPANDPALTTSAVHNPALTSVDAALNQPIVSKPAPAAPPQNLGDKKYSTDPYREIPE